MPINTLHSASWNVYVTMAGTPEATSDHKDKSCSLVTAEQSAGRCSGLKKDPQRYVDFLITKTCDYYHP